MKCAESCYHSSPSVCSWRPAGRPPRPRSTQQPKQVSSPFRQTTSYAITSAPPADLVVLDVRTPEEFSEGHLDSAINIDFYEADFGTNLANLDKDVPYVLYCRSGNRSGTTAQEMRSLGFTEVYEVDGGILSWLDSGLPLAGS